MANELMRIDDVARALQVPVGTLRHWRRVGKGPASIRLGRHVTYRRRDVDDWLAAQFDQAALAPRSAG